MLTHDELKQIGQIVRGEIQPIKEGVTDVQHRLGTVENRLETVENRLGTVENRLGNVEKDIKGLKSKVAKIAKNTDVMAKLFDRADVRIHKRVKRIEHHLGLDPIS